MPNNSQAVISRYLEDTIAAERNFENALTTFAKTGVQKPVQDLFAMAARKAKTQHERLTARLEQLGGSPSAAKTALAHFLAFSPLSAQIGQGATEKNTQHLMVTFAAASAEMAMYESLAVAAQEAGDSQTASLAKTLQEEERDDYNQVWSLIASSATHSIGAESESQKSGAGLIRDYLEDAIAAEKSFEDQLVAFSKEGDDPTVHSLFSQHAAETRTQYERLTERLNTLGGSTSVIKSFLAHVFNFTPKIAQLGHDESERITQNLMMAYAVENAEVAMYESLAIACRTAGDSITEQLAREIQAQERETAGKVWNQIAPAARRAVLKVSSASA